MKTPTLEDENLAVVQSISVEEHPMEADISANTSDDICPEFCDGTVPEVSCIEVENPPTTIEDNGDSLNEPMFKAVGLSKLDISTIIYEFSLKHQLTKKARQELFDILKCANLNEDTLTCSDYYLAKYFDPDENLLRYQFYCIACKAPISDHLPKSAIKGQLVKCSNKTCAQEDVISTASNNFFISIDVNKQITSMLNSTDIEILQQNKMEHVETITDISDGAVYKRAQEKLNLT